MGQKALEVRENAGRTEARLLSKSNEEFKATKENLSRVGGLMVASDPALSLNLAFELCVESTTGEAYWLDARVVHVSHHGAALEVKPLRPQPSRGWNDPSAHKPRSIKTTRPIGSGAFQRVQAAQDPQRRRSAEWRKVSPSDQRTSAPSGEHRSPQRTRSPIAMETAPELRSRPTQPAPPLATPPPSFDLEVSNSESEWAGESFFESTTQRDQFVVDALQAGIAMTTGPTPIPVNTQVHISLEVEGNQPIAYLCRVLHQNPARSVLVLETPCEPSTIEEINYPPIANASPHRPRTSMGMRRVSRPMTAQEANLSPSRRFTHTSVYPSLNPARAAQAPPAPRPSICSLAELLERETLTEAHFENSPVGHLMRISSQPRDALIEVRWSSTVLRFGLQQGLVVLSEARIGVKENTLADQLLQLGKIDQETHRKVLDWVVQNHQTQVKAFLSLHIFNTEKLIWLRRLTTARLLSQACLQSTGRLRWTYLDSLATLDPIPPIQTHSFISRLYLTETEKLGPGVLTSRWREIEDLVPEINKDSPCSTRSMDLSKDEKKIISDIEKGGYTVRRLSTRNNVNRWRIYALIQLLKTMEYLSLADGSKAAAEKVMERTRIALKKRLSEDSFKALGLHWSADDKAVEEGYQKACKELDPKQMPSKVADALKHLRENALSRVNEAYQTLKRRGDRHAYRLQIIGSIQISSSVNLDIDNAEWAVLRGELIEATELLRRAIELDPMNSRAKTLLGKVRAVVNR